MTFLFIFCDSVSSPPGTEKTVSNILYFLTFWALEIAELLYKFIAVWMIDISFSSFLSNLILVSVIPSFSKIILQLSSILLEGIKLSGLINNFNVIMRINIFSDHQ